MELPSLFQSPSIGVIFSGFRQSAIDPDKNAKCDKGPKTGKKRKELQAQGKVIIACVHDDVQLSIGLVCDWVKSVVAIGEGEK